jgi:hypothetical protein
VQQSSAVILIGRSRLECEIVSYLDALVSIKERREEKRDRKLGEERVEHTAQQSTTVIS